MILNHQLCLRFTRKHLRHQTSSCLIWRSRNQTGPNRKLEYLFQNVREQWETKVHWSDLLVFFYYCSYIKTCLSRPCFLTLNSYSARKFTPLNSLGKCIVTLITQVNENPAILPGTNSTGEIMFTKGRVTTANSFRLFPPYLHHTSREETKAYLFVYISKLARALLINSHVKSLFIFKK